MTEQLRVLYIDDDPGLARLVQNDLRRRGHSVEVVYDGPSGVRRLARGGIDAVALDHYMPGQDGLTTLREIQKLPAPPPVVYVTATQEGRVAVAALKAGAAEYVIKDVADEFFTLLSSAIQTAVSAVRLREDKEKAEAEVRAARDRFEALAAERDMLLREVNHRVSNSLQIIAAQLHLQASAAPGSEVKTALESARQRVMAVAQVHRRLYTSADVKTVALDEYLSALAADLRSASIKTSDTVLSVDTEPIHVEPDQAVAAGIIVTELVLNALKHAYPDGKGPIRIELRADGPTRTCFKVEDEGIGRLGNAAQSRNGMGDLIVKAMVAKLNGEWSYDPSHRGTSVQICFERDTKAHP